MKLSNLLLTTALLLIMGIANSQVVNINGFTRDFDASGDDKDLIKGHGQEWISADYLPLFHKPLSDYFLTDNLALNFLAGGGWRVATVDDMTNLLNNFQFIDGPELYQGREVPSIGQVALANTWSDVENLLQSRSYFYSEGAPMQITPLLDLFIRGGVNKLDITFGRDDDKDGFYNPVSLRANDIISATTPDPRGPRDFIYMQYDQIDVNYQFHDFVALVRDLPTTPPNVSADALGGEMAVNNTTLKNQRRPNVATDGNGNFLITWAYEITKWYYDGSNIAARLNVDIYARRYQSDGTPLGNEFRVNSSLNNSLTNPDVAMNASGKSVVIWQDFDSEFTGGTSDIYAQCYDANGSPTGGEIKVNQFVKNLVAQSAGLPKVSPKVAMDASGGFVATWHTLGQDNADLSPRLGRQTRGVFARRYLADCTPAGDEFQVNTFTTSDQINPDIAMAANGAFVITWESRDQDASGRSIYAQRFLADGSQAGVEFRVSSDLFVQETASIASSATGDFVITWDSVGQDGSSDGIYAQLYQADGSKVGTEFLVNTHTELSQKRPQVAMSATGEFNIIWQGYIQEDNAADPIELLPNNIMHVDFGVFARRYHADGSAKEAQEFVVNSEFNDRQERPVVAMDSDGDMVAAWQSWGQDDTDGSKGIYAQRFNGKPYFFQNGFE